MLDTAKTEQRDLEQSLKPPPPKRSFWDHALDIVASAGEVIGGVALMAFSGWTGVGAVAGGAIVVDGLFRLGHGISDAANGTTTDTPQSKLFQAFGASQQTANRIDTGVSIAATVPIAVGGAAITATRAASLIVKGVNVASAAMVLDGAQAQARYVATGEAVTPWTVDRLVAAGLSPTQANYALATGSIIATGAAAKVAARTAPATTTTATPAVATARATAPNVSVTPTSAATTTQVAGETTAPTAGSAQAALSANTTSSTGTANVSPTALPAAAGALLTDATSLTREPLAVVRSPHFADLEDVAPSSDPRPRQATLEQQRVHRTNGAGGSRPVNPSSGAGSAEPRATSPAGYKIGEITYRTDPSDPVRHRAPTDVAILGGGNVGFTLAADLALNSEFRPTLLFRGDGTGADRITPVTGAYTFNETLHGSTHTVNLRPEHFGYMDTLRGAQAMQEAKTIVVTIPDAPQSRLALFNHLQNAGLVDDPAKTIVLIRAGQAGQPALSQIIRENSGWKASVVLVEDSPYGTRVSHDPSGHVINGKRKDNVEISVLGEKGEQTPGLTAMREMFPLGEQISRPSWPDFTVVPGIEMPWRAGYFIHPGPAFDPVNLQKTARGEQYLHYSEGVHPELGERLQRIDQERVELAAAYGVRGETFPEKLERQFGLERRPEETFYETMQRTRDIYKSKSYPSLGTLLKSRYPQEDVPGLFTINWFARRANVDLPEHGAFEAHIRSTLQELGMPAWEIENNLGGYLPILHATEGGVPEITQLLDAPHIRPEA